MSEQEIKTELLKRVFEMDLQNKTVKLFGATWRVNNTNASKRTITLVLVEIDVPHDGR